MSNKSGNAYSLVTLCPIKCTSETDYTPVFQLRKQLQDFSDDQRWPVSFMAKVPNTYLARYFIIDDLFFQSFPNKLDNLKSKYLAFTANIYGDLDTYLKGMYKYAESEIKQIWGYCYGFEKVNDADSFVAFIKKCQMKTTFYFNGSTDDSLEEQLKALYIKQEFSKFVFAHQGASAATVHEDFKKFCKETMPTDLKGPTWKAGFSTLHNIVETQNKNKQLYEK